jgi:hypothetical protein
MEAKNETSSGGGTLPRQQRQAKRSVSNKIDLPSPLQLFNTDYTAEARKQMSMYYSTPSPSTDTNAIRRQSGPSLTDNDLCQKVEKCYIDGPSVHYGRTTTSQFQSPYHQHQMMYPQHQMHGGSFGKLYAGQFQTQAEVHVEQHSQIEVCMVS